MNPWLSIPLEDYEGHMSAVGQAAALREIFGRIYARVKPRRVAILGCTAGGDFDLLQSNVTEMAVGVDLNPAYIETAQRRASQIGSAVRWLCGDVLAVELPESSFDLVHAALLLEYVAAEQVFVRVRKWLRPHGLFSVVTQQPANDRPAVSSSRFASLQKLGATMRLRHTDEIHSLAAAAGYVQVESTLVELPNGKVLTHSVYKIAGGAEPSIED